MARCVLMQRVLMQPRVRGVYWLHNTGLALPATRSLFRVCLEMMKKGGRHDRINIFPKSLFDHPKNLNKNLKEPDHFLILFSEEFGDSEYIEGNRKYTELPESQHTHKPLLLENNPMSLIYRGQAAQPSATAKTVETGMMGTFLGRDFPIRKAQQPVRRAAPYLQYRGVMY